MKSYKKKRLSCQPLLFVAIADKVCHTLPRVYGKRGEAAMSYRAAICDDSTTDAEFVGSILHQWAAERGIEVESERFASADAFLFRYAEDKSFDLLLLDVEMPGTDGVTLAKTVRQEPKPCRSCSSPATPITVKRMIRMERRYNHDIPVFVHTGNGP